MILSGLKLQEIEQLMENLGATKFRAKQIHNWIYLKSVNSIDEMTDLLTVKADRNKSLKERRESYLNKVGNPYLVRIGNMKVKVRFANNGISLEQAFENMLLSV